MADEQDAKVDPSPTLEGAIASSPEVKEEATQQVQGTETGTPQQPASQEPQVEEEARIPYSRFKEKVDEANYLKGLLEKQLQAAQSNQQVQQPPQEEGATPEEREFWRNQRRIAREEALKVAQEREQQITPLLQATMREVTSAKVQEFRRSHPDIKPNSPEEHEIASKIRELGYSPDDAYWSVMGPRGIRVAVQQGENKVKQQIEAKRKANVETSASIPAQAQPQKKASFSDDFLRAYMAEEGKS